MAPQTKVDRLIARRATKALCDSCDHGAAQHEIVTFSASFRGGLVGMISQWVCPCQVPGCTCRNLIPNGDRA